MYFEYCLKTKTVIKKLIDAIRLCSKRRISAGKSLSLKFQYFSNVRFNFDEFFNY